MTRLTIEDVYSHCGAVCFKTGPPGTVGAETEWLVVDPTDPSRYVPPARWRDLLDSAGFAPGDALPGGSVITAEPGGQLEVSSAPYRDVGALHEALAGDLRIVGSALRAGGLALSGYGVDPAREPRLQGVDERYRCMSEYFGPAGRVMMCTTASVQVCLDIGADAEDAAARWRLAHRLTPVLVAAFANSPLQARPSGPYRPTGLKSTRQAIWSALDPGRTSAPSGQGDPAAAWTEYVLDARVMMTRSSDEPWTVRPGMTFRDWLSAPDGPTQDDLEYHVSTLFPPIRPRGWLEVRVIDALPEPYWPVAVAVAHALLDDPVAAEAAADAVEPLADRPDIARRAARDALADQEIADATRTCFDAARPALVRLGGSSLLPVFDDYRKRYVERGRCPADDVLDGGLGSGSEGGATNGHARGARTGSRSPEHLNGRAAANGLSKEALA